MIDTIYLDLDGVICDFEGRYIDLFKEMPGVSRQHKEFSKNWTEFVEGENFTKLEYWPGALDLLGFLGTRRNITLKILTSSGGHKYHDQVEKQKLQWLEENGITNIVDEVIVVPGRRKKAAYATPTSILIDDTADVIDLFTEEGGIGILHKNATNTIKLLKILLNT